MTRSRAAATLASALAVAAVTIALGLAGTGAPVAAAAPPASGAVAAMDTYPSDFRGDVVAVGGTFGVVHGWSITAVEAVLTRTVASNSCPPATTSVAVYPSNDVAPTTTTSTTAPTTTTTLLPGSTTTAAPTTTSTTQPADHTTTRQALFFRPVCNGSYALSIVVVADDDADTTGNVADERTTVYSAPISVSLRPQDVAATSTNLADHAVTVAWQPPAEFSPDLTGFVVQRAAPGGEFADLAGVSTDQRSYADTLAADAAGTYRYRVLVERAAAADGDKVRSAGGATATGQVSIRPPVVRQPSDARSATPPAAAPTIAVTIPPTTIDEGFSETLDYGETAQEPDGGDSLLDFAGSAGSGILVPFAIAECLAVWAMHLRYLARRADDL